MDIIKKTILINDIFDKYNKEDTTINWSKRIPPINSCAKCRCKTYSYSYSISLNIAVCTRCIVKMSDVSDLKPVISGRVMIDSEYINSEQTVANGFCLQSNPCQHSVVLCLNMFNNENTEKYNNECFQALDDAIKEERAKEEAAAKEAAANGRKIRTNPVRIDLNYCTIMDKATHKTTLTLYSTAIYMLILVKSLSRFDTMHYEKYSKDVPIIKAGDIIDVNDVMSIVVNKDFIDPRTITKTKTKTKC